MATTAMLFPLFFILFGQLGMVGPAAPAAPEQVAACHAAVAGHLQTGGDNYLVRHTAGRLEALVAAVAAMLPEEDAAKINAFLRNSGFYGLEAVGFSSVPRGDGMKDLRMVLRRDGQTAGLPAWKALLGDKPAPRTLLKYLPADTVLALDLSPDAEALWKLYADISLNFACDGDPQRAQKQLQALTEALGINPKTLLDSLQGEILVSLQFDEAKTSSLPVGRNAVQLPTPSFVLAARVADDRILRHILAKSEEAGKPWAATTEDVTIYSMPNPRPAPVPFDMAMTYVDNTLLVASTPAALHSALQSAGGKGLSGSAGFMAIFGKSPLQANALCYVDAAFAKVVHAAVKQAAEDSRGPRFDALLGAPPPAAGGWTIVNSADAVILQGVGTGGGFANLLQGAGSQLPMLLGVAIPSFSRSRSRAQDAMCLNNLRHIDIAKQHWALDHNPPATATPSGADLAPYLKDGFDNMRCPRGGTYTVGDMSTKPACSHPGHRLR